MKQLLRKKETILRKMTECSDYLRGSITSVCSTCNRAKCICKTKSQKRAYRLTYKDAQQKTKTMYIAKEQLQHARKKIRNYARYRELMNELLEINIALFKSER